MKIYRNLIMKTYESISELMVSHLFLNSQVCIYFTWTLVVIVSKSLQNIPWNQFYSLMLLLCNNQHLFWEKLHCKKGQKELAICGHLLICGHLSFSTPPEEFIYLAFWRVNPLKLQILKQKARGVEPLWAISPCS